MLADSITEEEKEAQERAEVKSYKNKKENLNFQENLEGVDDEMMSILGLPEWLNKASKSYKQETKQALFDILSQEKSLAGEKAA